MASNMFTVCVVVLILGCVLADEPEEDYKGPPTAANLVSELCPHGETFYRGCVQCPCEATIPANVLDQFPAAHLKVCAGEMPPHDCPDFQCATSKNYLHTTPCEGSCKCDPDTIITTCDRHPCPYE